MKQPAKKFIVQDAKWVHLPLQKGHYFADHQLNVELVEAGEQGTTWSVIFMNPLGTLVPGWRVEARVRKNELLDVHVICEDTRIILGERLLPWETLPLGGAKENASIFDMLRHMFVSRIKVEGNIEHYESFTHSYYGPPMMSNKATITHHRMLVNGTWGGQEGCGLLVFSGDLPDQYRVGEQISAIVWKNRKAKGIWNVIKIEKSADSPGMGTPGPASTSNKMPIPRIMTVKSDSKPPRWNTGTEIEGQVTDANWTKTNLLWRRQELRGELHKCKTLRRHDDLLFDLPVRANAISLDNFPVSTQVLHVTTAGNREFVVVYVPHPTLPACDQDNLALMNMIGDEIVVRGEPATTPHGEILWATQVENQTARAESWSTKSPVSGAGWVPVNIEGYIEIAPVEVDTLPFPYEKSADIYGTGVVETQFIGNRMLKWCPLCNEFRMRQIVFRVGDEDGQSWAVSMLPLLKQFRMSFPGDFELRPLALMPNDKVKITGKKINGIVWAEEIEKVKR